MRDIFQPIKIFLETESNENHTNITCETSFIRFTIMNVLKHQDTLTIWKVLKESKDHELEIIIHCSRHEILKAFK